MSPLTTGEVYRVNDTQLAALDELENVPAFYARKTSLIAMEDGERLECWLYALPKYRPELLEDETKFMDDYDAKTEGREYVPR